MRPGRNLAALGLIVLSSLLAAELYTRHTVKTTLPRQVLARYQPPLPAAHTVFLGSSLTDAGVDVSLLDTLAGAGPKARHFNLALAGLKGESAYRLIFENHVLPNGTPQKLVVETGFFPYARSEEKFDPLQNQERTSLALIDSMTRDDFLRLRGGRISGMEEFRFFLHKNWYGYHHRLETQARIQERVAAWIPSGHPQTFAPDTAFNPFRMAAGAEATFARWAEAALEAHGGGHDAEGGSGGFDSGLEELAELAQSAGVELWMLRLPCPPADSLLDGAEAHVKYMSAFRARCDQLGIRFLDLSRPPPGVAYTYSDGIHLDAGGRKLLTQELHKAWR